LSASFFYPNLHPTIKPYLKKNNNYKPLNNHNMRMKVSDPTSCAPGDKTKTGCFLPFTENRVRDVFIDILEHLLVTRANKPPNTYDEKRILTSTLPLSTLHS
jgi:hypothetical protein